MKAYQENWVESLVEFRTPWNKANAINNILGVCCEIIGDDTGDTDFLAKELATILRQMCMEKLTALLTED
jgi:hypothetical protein